LAFVLLIVSYLGRAQADEVRKKKESTFTVHLQPFSLSPTATAKPVQPPASVTPRILKAIELEPTIKAEPATPAYYKPPKRTPRTPRVHRSDDYEQLEDTPGDSIRMAYQTARAIPVRRPDTEDVENDESDEDQPTERQIDRTAPSDHAIVTSKQAVLRNGVAYAPAGAPDRVKIAVWAANSLRRKPYVWGGGHASFYDDGYDCSGSVSYALHAAGLIGAPLPSDELMHYGERGRGRWITIYSRRGHTFAVIAGLRFDTTDLDRGSNVGPRWYNEGRDTKGFVARHPAGL
jgi:cell wall-associated NlpC family hydrolase